MASKFGGVPTEETAGSKFGGVPVDEAASPPSASKPTEPPPRIASRALSSLPSSIGNSFRDMVRMPNLGQPPAASAPPQPPNQGGFMEGIRHVWNNIGSQPSAEEKAQPYQAAPIVNPITAIKGAISNPRATANSAMTGVGESFANDPLATIRNAVGVGQGIHALASGTGITPNAEMRPFSRIQPTSERLYQSTLKPSTTLGPTAIKGIVRTGLNERIPVTEGGLNKLHGKIEGINNEIGEKIADSPFEVSPQAVAGRIEGVRPRFDTVNPDSDQAALTRVKQEYLDKHTIHAPFTKVAPGLEEEAGRLVPIGRGSTPLIQPVPAAAAQAEKVNTYRQLRNKYGEQSAAEAEGQKALARGTKEELAQGIPEIQPLNLRESKLIQLQEPLERAAARGGNRMVVPIGSPSVSLAQKIIDNPWLKSNTAIQMNRLANAGIRFRSPLGGIQPAELPSELPSGQPSAQIPPHLGFDLSGSSNGILPSPEGLGLSRTVGGRWVDKAGNTWTGEGDPPDLRSRGIRP